MFDSVCLGLSYYKEKRKTAGKETLDGIFFFPVDVHCLRHLRWNMKNTGLRKAMGMSISRSMRKHRGIRF